MKYIVMECHRSYAVVLAEDGRFLKVANLRYEVGQTVMKVIEMLDTPLILESEVIVEEDYVEPEISETGTVIELGERKKKKSAMKAKTSRILAGVAAMAACMVVAVTSVMNMNRTPYGSVYMTINPEVRVDVNRKNIVIGVDGLNEDGDRLVEGYSYRRKALDPVMDELVDRAIDFGYLSAGGQITLSLEAEDLEWVESKSGELETHLNEYLTEKISVTIEIVKPDVVGDSMDTGAEMTKAPEYGDSVYEKVVIDWDDLDDKSETESYGDPGYGSQGDMAGDSGYDTETDVAGDSGYDTETEVTGDSGYDTETDVEGDSGYNPTVDAGESDSQEVAADD
ncbi:MAG: hypothetical protein IJ374_12480, partial [Lachnospiraceae bacterium]|nr:hypothetical protein [Lachnospiraceae bacterium]